MNHPSQPQFGGAAPRSARLILYARARRAKQRNATAKQQDRRPSTSPATFDKAHVEMPKCRRNAEDQALAACHLHQSPTSHWGGMRIVTRHDLRGPKVQPASIETLRLVTFSMAAMATRPPSNDAPPATTAKKVEPSFRRARVLYEEAVALGDPLAAEHLDHLQSAIDKVRARPHVPGDAQLR